jgi:hypothetical protein
VLRLKPSWCEAWCLIAFDDRELLEVFNSGHQEGTQCHAEGIHDMQAMVSWSSLKTDISSGFFWLLGFFWTTFGSHHLMIMNDADSPSNHLNSSVELQI